MLSNRSNVVSNRRISRSWLLLFVVWALLAVACGPTPEVTPDDTSPPATVDTTASNGETVPEIPGIPEAEVRFGVFPCCADNNVALIAVREGYFDDVGITIEPPPEGHHFSEFSQITPAMERGDHDIAVHVIQNYMQNLHTFAQDFPPIMFTTFNIGVGIMVPPDSDARTALEIMEEDGLSFAEAAAEAMRQLEGADLFTPPASAVRADADVWLSYAGLSRADVNVTFFEDPQIVELALVPGRVEFAWPRNNGIGSEMLREGWRDVISTKMILDHDPESEQAEQLAPLAGSTGLAAQRSFVEANRDTVLRLLSAMFRAIDVALDPAHKERVLQQNVADVANAIQGTDLTWENIATIYETLQPLNTWEDQRALWLEPGRTFIPDMVKTQVEVLIENETLPDQEYDLDRFLVARDLTLELMDLQEEADGLFERAEELPPEFSELIGAARTQYDQYNFLDAVRFLRVALGE